MSLAFLGRVWHGAGLCQTLISCFNNLSRWWQLKVTIKRKLKVAEQSREEAIKAEASKRWVSKWVWRTLIEMQYCFSGLHSFRGLISPSVPFNQPLSVNYIMCFPWGRLQFLLLSSHTVTFKDALSSAGAGQSCPAAEHRPSGHTQVQMYPSVMCVKCQSGHSAAALYFGSLLLH